MIDPPRPLLGQVALITGASRGIGRALATGLAAAGMAVGLLGRDKAQLEAVRDQIVDAGGTAVALTADVTDPVAVADAVNTLVGRLGPIDLLVNNAGRIESAEGPVWEADPDEWWAVVEANLLGPFLLAHAVVPGMVALGGGRVVDLNSGFGTRDSGVYSAYAASKAGLFRLGGAIARAGADRGVYAFEVAPGVVRCGMAGRMPMWAEAPPSRFTPVDRTVTLVTAIAEGRLDALSGRYLRADVDEVDTLVERADDIAQGQARTLGIRTWGADDPLA